MKSDLFDGRLKKIVIKMVDVSYGGENGFAQAIEPSQDATQREIAGETHFQIF